MGKLKKIIILMSALCTTLLFQNCGDELNLEGGQGNQASSEPNVSLLIPAQFIENSDYNLTAVVNNVDDPTYSWWKDGVELVGETAAVLSFRPIALTDAGTYEVRIPTDGDPITASTVVSVQADPNAPTTQVFTNTSFTINGGLYFIYTTLAANDAAQKQVADNFCKGKTNNVNSVAVAYTVNQAAQITTNIAFYTAENTCQTGISTVPVMSHCGFSIQPSEFFIPTFNRYTMVECQL